MTNTTRKSDEKAVAKREMSDESLREIQSLEDAIALMQDVYGAENIVTADQIIGNGFRILRGREKDRLIGVACAFVKWSENPGKFGNEVFVSAMVVTESREKFIINDSSAGIANQLMGITADTGRTGGVLARHGLSRSDYEYCEETRSSRCNDETHTHTDAATYYIDMTA